MRRNQIEGYQRCIIGIIQSDEEHVIERPAKRYQRIDHVAHGIEVLEKKAHWPEAGIRATLRH